MWNINSTSSLSIVQRESNTTGTWLIILHNAEVWISYHYMYMYSNQHISNAVKCQDICMVMNSIILKSSYFSKKKIIIKILAPHPTNMSSFPSNIQIHWLWNHPINPHLRWKKCKVSTDQPWYSYMYRATFTHLTALHVQQNATGLYFDLFKLNNTLVTSVKGRHVSSKT